MELRLNIPFQRLLKLVKALSPAQKSRLKAALNQEDNAAQRKPDPDKDAFIDFLLAGPVYEKGDIRIISENRKSIASWRTKG